MISLFYLFLDNRLAGGVSVFFLGSLFGQDFSGDNGTKTANLSALVIEISICLSFF